MAFNEQIEKYTIATPAHAEELNKRQYKLLENDMTLKAQLAEKTNNIDDARLTSAKDVTGALNELFTCGNNVKSNTVDALLQIDKSLQIHKNSTWGEITKNISKISIGKKWASGNTSVTINTLTINDLSFTPSIIIINLTASKFSDWGGGQTRKYSYQISDYINGSKGSVSTLEITRIFQSGENGYSTQTNSGTINTKILSNGFKLTGFPFPSSYDNAYLYWTAYE